MSAAHHRRRGFSLLGMLITMACIVILLVILGNSLNLAITGRGSPLEGTVRSYKDQFALNAMYQAMMIAGQDYHGGDHLPVPSVVVGGERSLDTTANLYSMLIAANYLTPSTLVAANEYNPYINVKSDYNYSAFHARDGLPWDTSFSADLGYFSHSSFAHMPLFGERFDRGWRFGGGRAGAGANPQAVLLGNRGPEGGIDVSHSFTYGRARVWGGHFVFGDGRVEFHHAFTPPGLTYESREGGFLPDNVFAMETGPHGHDAIIGFTREMTADGPILQWD
jgi:hypothetical protein